MTWRKERGRASRGLQTTICTVLFFLYVCQRKLQYVVRCLHVFFSTGKKKKSNWQTVTQIRDKRRQTGISRKWRLAPSRRASERAPYRFLCPQKNHMSSVLCCVVGIRSQTVTSGPPEHSSTPPPARCPLQLTGTVLISRYNNMPQTIPGHPGDAVERWLRTHKQEKAENTAGVYFCLISPDSHLERLRDMCRQKAGSCGFTSA